MLIDNITASFEKLVQDNSRVRAADKLCQHALAVLDRSAAQILAIQLDQIKSNQDGIVTVAEYARPLALVTMASPSSRNEFAGRCRQRKPRRKVAAVAGHESDTGRVAARHDTEAVMFDFVNPARPYRWLLGRRWQARLIKTRNAPSTQTQQNHGRLNRGADKKSRIVWRALSLGIGFGSDQTIRKF